MWLGGMAYSSVKDFSKTVVSMSPKVIGNLTSPSTLRTSFIIHPLGRVGRISLGSIKRSSLPQQLALMDIKTPQWQHAYILEGAESLSM